MKSSFKQSGGTYRQVGDFKIPNLTLPHEESNITLGKWGMLHKDYLLEYKKVVFITLLTQGKVWQYLADIDTQARNKLDLLVTQLAEKEGINECLKAQDQLAWVRAMNNIRNRAEEIVLKELIYVEDAV